MINGEIAEETRLQFDKDIAKMTYVSLRRVYKKNGIGSEGTINGETAVMDKCLMDCCAN